MTSSKKKKPFIVRYLHPTFNKYIDIDSYTSLEFALYSLPVFINYYDSEIFEIYYIDDDDNAFMVLHYDTRWISK